MDEKTLEALKASIEHWRFNCNVTFAWMAKVNVGSCALCELYYCNNYCRDCPIAISTGTGSCRETPYVQASEAPRKWHNCRSIEDNVKAEKAFKDAAQAEMEFLISLLPPESTETE